MIEKDLALFQELCTELMQSEKEQPVLDPIPADQLFETLDLQLEESPADEKRFGKALRSLILNTPRTATPDFYNQLFGGRSGKGVLGDLLAVMLNNSMYTYKVAGPMVGVEKEILHKMAGLIGYPDTADGTLAPGGSMTNYMAMVMARDRFDPEIRQKGVRQPMTMYTSKESHYSIPKNAAFMGVGRDNLRYIPTDDRGRMRADLLQAQIRKDREAGLQPFFINATAGTTVLGAFDDLEAISQVARDENLWLHVDGAYCGAVAFSNTYRHLIQGVEKADSFSVNAHKMLAVPLSCSIILTREKRHLVESFSNDAEYLYQTDDDNYNLGKTSLQCGRRNDGLKFWTLWKAIGTKGLGQMVDHQFQLAEQARQYVTKNPDYEVYSFENSIGVCFNYKDYPADVLCNGLYEAGELMIGYGQFRDQKFVRLVTVNSGIDELDLERFFKKLEHYADTQLKGAESQSNSSA